MTIHKSKMSPFARELAQSMEEAISYLKGEGAARETRLALPDPPPKVSQKQIQTLRKRFDLTQAQFARLMNVSAKTVEGWEQGVRAPSGVALRMLQFIGHPDVFSSMGNFSGSRTARKGAPRVIGRKA
jgi:putative transcriptional regulator